MKSKNERKIRKEDLIASIIVFICLILIYLPWLKGHNAGDNYVIANEGYISYAVKNFLPSGRLITSLYAIIMNMLNINVKTATTISLFLSIIIQVITIMYLKKMIEKHKKNKALNKPKAIIKDVIETLIATTVVSNFFMVDCECFFESFVLATSFLLAIIAANTLATTNVVGKNTNQNADKNINKNIDQDTDIDKNANADKNTGAYNIIKVKQYLKTLSLCLLSTICYQSAITIFMAFVLFIGILENKKAKEIIKDIVKSISITLIVLIVNLILVKTLSMYAQNIYFERSKEQASIANVGEKRISFNIQKNIKNILYNTNNVLINTCNLYPKYLLVIFIAEIIFITISYVLKNRQNLSLILKLVLIVNWFILCSFSISLITSSSFTTGRLRIVIGMLAGVMLMYSYIKLNLLDFKNEVLLSSLFLITLLIYFLMNIVSIRSFIIDQNQVELLDKENAKVIEKAIESYEMQNNTEIKYVVEIPITGKRENAYYSGSKLNSSALKTLTTAGASINYYTKRNLQYKSMSDDTENVKEYIEEGKEGKIGAKGYKLLKDTLYISVYNW